MADSRLKPSRRWCKRAVVLACLVVLPYLVHQVYVSWSGLPANIRIATGTVGGRYRAVADALGDEIAARSGVSVEMVACGFMRPDTVRSGHVRSRLTVRVVSK